MLGACLRAKNLKRAVGLGLGRKDELQQTRFIFGQQQGFVNIARFDTMLALAINFLRGSERHFDISRGGKNRRAVKSMLAQQRLGLKIDLRFELNLFQC